MGTIIRNRWQQAPSDPLARARILAQSEAPEGVEVERVRAVQAGALPLADTLAHVVSVISGDAQLHVGGDALRLQGGVHAFLPRAAGARIELSPGTELVRISAEGARGTVPLLRDEAFISAAAVEGHALRWVLTPQYLSRRVFLHHDAVLLSKSGRPMSWFHTTMFDVEGLPLNADGESVFKMSYDSRTELNVCYDVAGDTRVRMAIHPYGDADQQWGPWSVLDGDTTYHLDEDAADPHTGAARAHRNKHEVYARAGYVSLFCSFDPAPTGIERHQPGAYSDYEPLSSVIARPEYAVHQREMARLDAMIDTLSLARARGTLDALRGTDVWGEFERGRAAQRAVEAALIDALAAEGRGRDRVVESWRSREAV